MNKLPLGLLLSAALLTTLLPVGDAATTTTPLKFGMDSNSVAAQKAAGVAPDYGTFWIGPWTLKSGWGGPDADLAAMKSAGVTPAVHFYYWGDDISPSCVENGCWSSLHQAQKTRAGWATLGTQLTQHLNAKMGGAPVVVFLESEFNKGGISTYEPYDGYLAEMAKKINAAYPAAIVVLGFGAWDSGNWYRFDRAAAASEMVGVQAMRGSTKDSLTHYNNVDENTLSYAQKLQSLFHKPIMLTDVALSSYPDSTYAKVQADNLAAIFADIPALKAAGVKSIVYRSWRDSPNMDLANYYGQAERHWGLAKADGTQKAAAKVWIAGVKAERSGTSAPAPSTSTTSTSTTTTFKATFTPKSQANNWWIETTASGNQAIAKVEAKVNAGSYVTLDKTSYGTYAKSINAPDGAKVTFRATSTSGATATSVAYTWG